MDSEIEQLRDRLAKTRQLLWGVIALLVASLAVDAWQELRPSLSVEHLRVNDAIELGTFEQGARLDASSLTITGDAARTVHVAPNHISLGHGEVPVHKLTLSGNEILMMASPLTYSVDLSSPEHGAQIHVITNGPQEPMMAGMSVSDTLGPRVHLAGQQDVSVIIAADDAAKLRLRDGETEKTLGTE